MKFKFIHEISVIQEEFLVGLYIYICLNLLTCAVRKNLTILAETSLPPRRAAENLQL